MNKKKILMPLMVFGVLMHQMLCRDAATGYRNGIAGYLYNIGSEEYLTQYRTAKDKYTWFKGTTTPGQAIKLVVHRVNYKEDTYSVILSDSMQDLHKGICSSRVTNSAPFYGYNALSLIGDWTSEHIGFTQDTSVPQAWVSFSPAVYRHQPVFRIYIGNRCATLESKGYLKLQPCIAHPEVEKNKQLFKWLAVDHYVSHKGKPVKKKSIPKKPIKKKTVPKRTRGPQKHPKKHEKPVDDEPKDTHDVTKTPTGGSNTPPPGTTPPNDSNAPGPSTTNSPDNTNQPSTNSTEPEIGSGAVPAKHTDTDPNKPQIAHPLQRNNLPLNDNIPPPGF
ncbi:hypothetical protein NEOKW01_1361 [Nematocida sp. AWRm80]|nr:hypothetical protein NEOKW01_1361 [Nematocida sp. AWRm80]